jgi:hypothetical protein
MTSTRNAAYGAHADARTMVPDPRQTSHTDDQTD